MALIKIKQINNSPASAGQVITFNGTNNVWATPSGAGLATITTFAGLPGSPSTNDQVFYVPYNSIMIYDGTDWCGPKISSPIFGREGTGNGNVWLHTLGRTDGHPQGGNSHGYVMPNIISGSGGNTRYKFSVLTGGSLNAHTGDLEIHVNATANVPTYATTGVILTSFAAETHVTAESTPARLIDGGDLIHCFWRRTSGSWKDWTVYAVFCLVAGA